MSESYRQSALLLYGLGETDRRWVLSQLADDQRRDLTAQLTELGEIGMPVDRSLAEELLAGTGARLAHRPTVDAPDHGATLRRAPAQAMLQLLATQPSWLIAAVLGIEAWPWREAIYVGLDASKRERVKQAMGTRLPEKLACALVSCLEVRLKTAEMPEPRTTPGSLTRLVLGLRQWTRS